MTDSPVPFEDDLDKAADHGSGERTRRSSTRRCGPSRGRNRPDPASRWIEFAGAGTVSWAAADHCPSLSAGVTASAVDMRRLVSPMERVIEASVAGRASAVRSGSLLSGVQRVLEESAISRAGSALAMLQTSSVPTSWQKSVAAGSVPLAAAVHRSWSAALAGGSVSGSALSFDFALGSAGVLKAFEAMQTSQARVFEQAGGMVGAFDALAASNARITEQLRAGLASSWKEALDPTALRLLSLQQAGIRTDLGSMLSGLAGFPDWDSVSKSLFETVGSAVRAAERLGKRMFAAVVKAQQAVLAGDMEAVEAFFAEWTDMPKSRRQARVFAGSEALLEVDFEQWDPADGFELIEHVESGANRLFQRGRRPLTETTLKHSPVVSLESARETIGSDAVDGQMPVSPSAEYRVLMMLNQFDGELAMALLGGLSPVDAQIAMARGFAVSWDDAAQLCGLPASEGERVRAKLKRRITITASRKRGR